MNSILYSVKIGGKNTDIFNIKNLLDGIDLNSFFDNYEIHFFVEENIEKDLYAFLKKIEQSKHLKIFYYNTLSWYNWLKYSFKNSLNFDYLITCHDDVYIQTKNFDKVFIEQLSSVENIGTFSFIDSGYKRRFFNPQLRGAYHIDRVYSNSRALGIEYEYHNQKKNWHKKMVKLKKALNLINLANKKRESFFEPKLFEFVSKFFLNFDSLDLPKKTIRAHSVWANLMGFKTSNLKLFEVTDLQISHGLYADEDICMSTQNNGLINILIPQVNYYHDREIDITRSWKDIKNDQNKVSKLFYNKWKFYPTKLENIKLDERLEIIKFLELEYDKKLTWTKDQYSYDWQYIN